MMDELEAEDVGLEDEAAFEASVVEDMGSTSLPLVEARLARPAAEGGSEAAAPPGKRPAWAGKLLGRFRLLRLIGSGAMGFVVQAMDVNLHRIVALKILRRRVSGVDQQGKVEQFLREARAAAQIEHPNVVRVYEIDQRDGWWYIAMEMVEGGDLKSMVKAAGPLSPERACPLIADAATALDVAHELGIIHRDVKPSNVMITRGGRGKLTDFGLVRVDDPNDPFDFTDKSVGTPHFMAPEVIRRQRPTPAVDVYSLAATLYFALTGKLPYTAEKLTAVVAQQLRAAPPDVREHLPQCPVSLAALIQRAMAKDPADRPTAAELAAALRAEAITWVRDQSAAQAPPAPVQPAPAETPTTVMPAAGAGPPRRKRLLRRRWVVAGAAALAVAAVAAVVFVWGPGGPPGGLPAAARLAERFPDAPQTYGVLPAGEAPEPLDPRSQPPAFSWLGKIDPAPFKYVASTKGRCYYLIDCPAAALIREDLFVGYGSADQARADGKVPAP